jgi:hypothetical protein
LKTVVNKEKNGIKFRTTPCSLEVLALPLYCFLNHDEFDLGGIRQEDKK